MAAAPAQRDRGFQDVAQRDALRQQSPGFARGHQVAVGVALVHRLQHVEQGEAGEEGRGQAGDALEIGRAEIAFDRFRRPRQPQPAAQLHFADQRRGLIGSPVGMRTRPSGSASDAAE